MKEKNYTGLIPENEFGKEITTQSSIILDTSDDAKHFCEVAKQRLLSIKKMARIGGDTECKLSINRF